MLEQYNFTVRHFITGPTQGRRFMFGHNKCVRIFKVRLMENDSPSLLLLYCTSRFNFVSIKSTVTFTFILGLIIRLSRRDQYL